MELPEGVETIVYEVRRAIGDLQPNDEIVIRSAPDGRPTVMLCRRLRSDDVEPLLASGALILRTTEPPEMRSAVAVSLARAPSRRRSQPHLVR